MARPRVWRDGNARRWIALAAIASSACSTADATRPGAGPPLLRLSPCHVDRLAEEVLCGVHEVYEDREAGAGHRLSIHVAVLPALRRDKRPDPLFMLAGGPGQGARALAPLADRALRKIRRTRDIVLVDLRGTGASHPLICPPGTGELSALWLDPEQVRACLAALEGDPRHYGHRESLADLDEIRARLGYDRVNLWGGSWGTRAALLYASLFPRAVRAVILDGAVPLGQPFPLSMAADGQRALDLTFEACESDPACRDSHPTLRADFHALTRDLAARPIGVAVRHPRTGRRHRVTLTASMLGEIVRAALYLPADASLLPALLLRAARGDLAPLLAEALRVLSWSIRTMALGATLSVLCTEDVGPLTDAEIDEAARGSFVDRASLAAWRAACEVWPRGRAPEVDATVVLAAPALILSGDLDPVTPPRWGAIMAHRFDDARHVIVPGGGHNVSFAGCMPDLLAEFLDRGTGRDLDAGCLSSVVRPPFVVSHAGPTP